MANDDRTLTESFIGASPFLIKVLELVSATEKVSTVVCRV